ncbi:MAG: AI-2E family transporter, partial [Candidatus Schmidhempelia sp.]|nr:AI-2E family transporter [Candidatus Schmidhempelia sp.]
MFRLFMDWYQRRFSDPNAIALTVVLILLFIIIYFFHSILTPLLIAIVLSYLLEKPVALLTSLGLTRTLAVTMILHIFISMMLLKDDIILPL